MTIANTMMARAMINPITPVVVLMMTVLVLLPCGFNVGGNTIAELLLVLVIEPSLVVTTIVLLLAGIDLVLY